MKQQRGTDQDIDEAAELLGLVEQYLTGGTITDIQTGERVPANDTLFVNALKEIYDRRFGTNWRRVVFGFETLVKNVCDPKCEILELRADYKRAIEFPRDVSAVLDLIGHPARGRHSFTRALGDRLELLRRLCTYAERRGAELGESPAWIVCKILKLSYALSRAVYEMYRDQAATMPVGTAAVDIGSSGVYVAAPPPCSSCGEHEPLIAGVCARCRAADTVVVYGPHNGQ